MKKFKWLFYTVFIVLIVAFIGFTKPNLVQLAILLGIIFSSSLYSLALIEETKDDLKTKAHKER